MARQRGAEPSAGERPILSHCQPRPRHIRLTSVDDQIPRTRQGEGERCRSRVVNAVPPSEAPPTWSCMPAFMRAARRRPAPPSRCPLVRTGAASAGPCSVPPISSATTISSPTDPAPHNARLRSGRGGLPERSVQLHAHPRRASAPESSPSPTPARGRGPGRIRFCGAWESDRKLSCVPIADPPSLIKRPESTVAL